MSYLTTITTDIRILQGITSNILNALDTPITSPTTTVADVDPAGFIIPGFGVTVIAYYFGLDRSKLPAPISFELNGSILTAQPFGPDIAYQRAGSVGHFHVVGASGVFSIGITDLVTNYNRMASDLVIKLDIHRISGTWTYVQMTGTEQKNVFLSTGDSFNLLLLPSENPQFNFVDDPIVLQYGTRVGVTRISTNN
jgi:hypothetical protein